METPQAAARRVRAGQSLIDRTSRGFFETSTPYQRGKPYAESYYDFLKVQKDGGKVLQNPYDTEAIEKFAKRVYGSEFAFAERCGNNPVSISRNVRMRMEEANFMLASWAYENREALKSRLMEADKSKKPEDKTITKLVRDTVPLINTDGANTTHDYVVSELKRRRDLVGVARIEDPNQRRQAMLGVLQQAAKAGKISQTGWVLMQHEMERTPELYFDKEVRMQDAVVKEILTADVAKAVFNTTVDTIEGAYGDTTWDAGDRKDMQKKTFFPIATAMAEAVYKLDDKQKDEEARRNNPKTDDRLWAEERYNRMGMTW